MIIKLDQITITMVFISSREPLAKVNHNKSHLKMTSHETTQSKMCIKFKISNQAV